MLRWLPLLVVLAALAPPAPAGAVPVVEAPAAELLALTAARDLIEVTGAEAALEASAMRSFDRQLDELRAVRPELGDGARQEAFRAIFQDELRRSLPEVLDAMTRLWAMSFSAEEIGRLAAFYRTPLGRKVLRRMPTIMGRAQTVGAAWGAGVGERAVRRFDARLRDEGS